jgi:hypothetical protein
VDSNEAGSLPYKLEFETVTHPDRPKDQVIISRWEEASPEESLFAFTPPADATRVEMVPRRSGGSDRQSSRRFSVAFRDGFGA